MWFTRLLNVFRPDRVSRDIRREMEFHLSEREDDLAAGGMSRDDAMREARRRFGNPTVQRERTRDADLLGWLEALLGDVRYALRSLGWSKGFTVVAVASLALGIGANTAIFSLINAVMLRALPVQAPEELVRLKYAGGQDGTFTHPLWEQMRDGPRIFDGVLAYGDERFNLAESGESRMAQGLWVSGSFFEVLGVRAQLGRTLTSGDDVRGCPATAVVSDGFWRSQLGGDAAAIGRTIRLDGHSFVVAGVLEPGFQGMDVGRSVGVYVPFCSAAIVMGKDNFLDARSWWFIQVLGRIPDGETAASISAKLTPASATYFANTIPTGWPADALKQYGERRLDVGESLASLSELRTSYEKALFVLMGIVAVVLLIACANVANLMLARSATRERELAVRVAIGAGRGRIFRQLFTEGLLLAVLGAALGTAFAWWGSQLLVGYLSTSRNPVQLDLTLDVRVLGFTMAVAVLTAILFGLAPSWRAMRVDPQVAMKAQGRGVVEGHGRFRVGKALVALQVGMSLVLLSGAGLLLGSFRSLSTVDVGFQPEGLLAASADFKLPPERSDADRALQGSIVERLRAIPGVTAAASSFRMPVSTMGWNDAMRVEGRTFARFEDAEIWLNAVWEGYFATVGTRLVAGRDFTPRDVEGAPRVAILNEAAVKRFFPPGSALGRTFRFPVGDTLSPPYEVVGVVADAKYRDLREVAKPQGFFPMWQSEMSRDRAYFMIRTQGDPSTLAPAVTRAVLELAPNASLSFTTMPRQISESMTQDRVLATLSGFFGALALVLAMIGLYGTMAYTVARRRNEIGIRIALGAAQSRVLRSVLGEVGRLVAIGVALGAVGAIAVTPFVEAFLFGRGARDPFTLLAASALLASVALLAGYLPARRAARMDPMETLREE